jgi:MFS family permease
MFSFLQFVASPLVGGLSDVYGRKPVMLICLVSLCISLVNLLNFILVYLLLDLIFFSRVCTFFFNRLELHLPMFCGLYQKVLLCLCWRELWEESAKAM